MRVLVTGATGYVGGRLVPRLIEAGHAVRVLVRDASKVEGRAWADAVEVFEGDLLDPASLADAVAGVEAAYYLVHSMATGPDFAKRDRDAAGHFVEAARAAGVGHVVYLGGLMPEGECRSDHLASRAEVGRVLASGLAVTEFRAGPIIGSGSASFEMVRYLTERLPAMITPRWVNNTVQPIGVRDVLRYLVEALRAGPCGVVPIGADRLTFKSMMQEYAAARGLSRVIVPVPVLAPWLAARWVGLVTPIPNALAVPLIKGVVQPLSADTGRAEALFPGIQPMPYRAAVDRALQRIHDHQVETRWTGAGGDRRRDERVEVTDWEGVIREERVLPCEASVEDLFAVVQSLGGERGWLVWEWAWSLRGVLDRLVGGPGLRRGRRDPKELLVGEALDWWRVETIEPPRHLCLRAEMKVPGAAWLEFRCDPEPGGGSRLQQLARFAPKGLTGALYWYGLYPIHQFIFTDLARAIVREAEQARGSDQSAGTSDGGNSTPSSRSCSAAS